MDLKTHNTYLLKICTSNKVCPTIFYTSLTFLSGRSNNNTLNWADDQGQIQQTKCCLLILKGCSPSMSLIRAGNHKCHQDSTHANFSKSFYS